MKHRSLSASLVLGLSILALVGLVACDSASPVAPNGTVLTITASDTQIGLQGSTTITVVGRRPDGNPLNPGTEVRFSTDRGTIDPIVEADASGVARAVLRADGRSGTATVSATTGAGGEGAASAEITIQIGENEETKPTLLLTVNPSNVPVLGEATVTLIARNADGSPFTDASAQVILTTSLGSLNPNRPTLGSDGVATSRLDAGTQAGTATISAIVGASDEATTSLTIRDAAVAISVQANPPSVPRAGGTTTITAFVTNSQGLGTQGAQVQFTSNVGSLPNNGLAFTDSAGVATITLTVTQQQLAGVNSFQVTGVTPDGTGNLLSDSTPVTVEG